MAFLEANLLELTAQEAADMLSMESHVGSQSAVKGRARIGEPVGLIVAIPGWE